MPSFYFVKRKENNMPHAPKRPCRYPNCRNLCEPGKQYCRVHTNQQMREYNAYNRDKEAQAFYNSKAWRSTRLQQLRSQPLCEECLRNNRITPATLVDHIIPIKDGGARLDFNNLQSLCQVCHEIKSINEGSRFGIKG